MASLETRRYDGKLDSFLHRNLSREDYERICTSEPCVVVYPEEKRVHKYVILGHRCLYLADFPPKAVKVAVNLQDVESVRMLDDLPDFLSGKEQEETVHIQIYYTRVLKERKLLGTLSEKSPAVLKKVMSKRSESRRASSLIPSRSSFQQSLPIHESSLVASTTSFTHSQSVYSFSPLVEKKPHRKTQSLSPISSNELGKRVDSVKYKRLPNGVSPQRVTSSLSSVKETTLLSRASSMKSVASGGLTASKSNMSHASSIPDFASKKYSQALFLQQHASSPNLSSSTFSLDSFKSSSSLSLASLPEKSTTSESGMKTERAVMDLYILKQTTDFYHQLSTTWEDFKIRQTLEQTHGCSSPPRPLGNTSLSYEHFSQHYCTLKRDLLSAKRIETSAQLVQELCTACQKYFVIKKMFWEDSELFEFCVEQLRNYLSPRGRRIGCTKADEIEYSIVLMDLLYQMLRESHVFSKRLVLLTRNSGQMLLELATIIIQLLPEHKPNNLELQEFDGDLSEKSCGVLFELIRITQQVRWPPSKQSTVSTTWLVEALATTPNIMEFCARMVDYASSVLSGPSDPQAQITLYHTAVIMSTLVHNCSGLVLLFRTHFTEEFRYFISISGAKQRLPETNHLTRSTLEHLHSAKSKILH